jgi:hypothetical protein
MNSPVPLYWEHVRRRRRRGRGRRRGRRRRRNLIVELMFVEM